jgi:Skp family chaperone for outer membrane proteins
MPDNKSFWLPCSIILGSLIILGGLVWAANAFTFKMAVVDLNKISKESPLGQKYSQDIVAKQKELQKKFQAAKTDAEKSQISSEFESYKSSKEAEFVNKATQAVKTVAKQKRVKVVSSPQVFLYSDPDTPADVIKALK